MTLHPRIDRLSATRRPRRSRCVAPSRCPVLTETQSVAVASAADLAIYTFGGALYGRAEAAIDVRGPDTSCRQERWLQLQFNIPGTPAAGETSFRASAGLVRNSD